MIANRVIRKVSDTTYVPLTEEELAADPAIELKALLSAEKKKLEGKRKAKEAMKERQRALQPHGMARQHKSPHSKQLAQKMFVQTKTLRPQKRLSKTSSVRLMQ